MRLISGITCSSTSPLWDWPPAWHYGDHGTTELASNLLPRMRPMDWESERCVRWTSFGKALVDVRDMVDGLFSCSGWETLGRWTSVGEDFLNIKWILTFHASISGPLLLQSDARKRCTDVPSSCSWAPPWIVTPLWWTLNLLRTPWSWIPKSLACGWTSVMDRNKLGALKLKSPIW